MGLRKDINPISIKYTPLLEKYMSMSLEKFLTLKKPSWIHVKNILTHIYAKEYNTASKNYTAIKLKNIYLRFPGYTGLSCVNVSNSELKKFLLSSGVSKKIVDGVKVVGKNSPRYKYGTVIFDGSYDDILIANDKGPIVPFDTDYWQDVATKRMWEFNEYLVSDVTWYYYMTTSKAVKSFIKEYDEKRIYGKKNKQ